MANRKHVAILKQGVEVWNQWRREHPKVKPNLEGINFVEANLQQINLTGTNLVRARLISTNLTLADLTGANLTEADLHEAVFTTSILIGVNLTDAELSGADLSGTDLTDANLTESELLGTNFTQTNLNGTDFYKAKILATQFSSVDLSNAKNLESVEHYHSSEISINTLIASKGKIPEIFLRGCGVPEDFINYLPSLLAKPVEFYSCFISYSHADKAFARQLHDFLQGRGIRCWLDEHQLLPGHDIFEEVDRGIKLWDKVLLCASKDSLSSWWVDNEINRAFKKEQTIMKSRGKKVLALIPLDLDGFIFSGWENGKAEQVKSRLAADFQGWQNDNDKLQQQFELVLKALRTDGGREAPPISRL